MESKRFILLTAALLILLFLGSTGCEQFPLVLPTQTLPPPTETVTPSPLPTATRIWFPATDTPQPQSMRPTMTPTLDIRPISGAVLVSDDFSETNRWGISSATYGSAAYGREELTIALREPRRSLYSFFQEPVPADYYLEMMVNPSLCKGEDLFGIAFRVQSDSQFYRFSLRCDGQVRIDLIQNSTIVPVALLETGSAFRPGPMQDFKVALWLQGDEVRVYVNDAYQVSAYRLRWQMGSLGVFARSAGENALTVNFYDLVLRESSAFPPTPIPSETPQASPTNTPLKQP